MSVRSKNGIDTIAATRIRRPCNRNPGRAISLSVVLVAAIAMLAVFASPTQAQKDKVAQRINDNVAERDSIVV